MATRRAIRCGVRAGLFFNGRWRDKFLSSRAQKDAAFRLSRDAAFFLLQNDAVDRVWCRKGENVVASAALIESVKSVAI